MVRSYFEAHGVPVVINAENHAGLLGGLGGALVPLHIYVDDDHAEAGAQLLSDLRRESDSSADEDDTDDDEPTDVETEALRELRAAEMRKRRRMAVVLLAVFVTFGTAHALTGAWKRAVALLVTEGVALSYIVNGQSLGIAVLAACIVTDLVGALARVRREGHTVPAARVVV